MSQGYLSIETRIANDGIPIEGAKVYIKPSSQSGEVSDTYYTNYLITDSSGNTGFVRFDTPPPQISENIGSTIRPYSLVDVYVTADGFFPTRIKNVQIFGEIQSILPVTMIPISGTYTDTEKGTINYDIPDNQLLSEDGHSMKGPSNIQAGPLISEEIYIPETITVHLGTPSSNARNVTVPFTEYVKNVVSSEIEPLSCILNIKEKKGIFMMPFSRQI